MRKHWNESDQRKYLNLSLGSGLFIAELARRVNESTFKAKALLKAAPKSPVSVFSPSKIDFRRGRTSSTWSFVHVAMVANFSFAGILWKLSALKVVRGLFAGSGLSSAFEFINSSSLSLTSG